MKKKNIIFILTTVLFISLIFSINYVKADSGWDYDYDSGGSWGSDYDSDWGSDWDSDWDSGWGSSHSGNSSLTLSQKKVVIIIFTLSCIVIIISSLNLKWTSRRINTSGIPKKRWSSYLNTSRINQTQYTYNKAANYNNISDNEVFSKLGLTSSEFKDQAFNIYKNIQNAWAEFDYKKLRHYTTDEIYNSYIMQLDTLKLKNQKNIMTDIECIDVKIYNIKEENGILKVDVYMNIRMYDYVADGNNRIVRGTNQRKANIEYELTFVKSNKKTSKKDTICPNCGAKIPATTGGKCEYCGSIVVIEAKEFVMSRKTCINQRMD